MSRPVASAPPQPAALLLLGAVIEMTVLEQAVLRELRVIRLEIRRMIG